MAMEPDTVVGTGRGLKIALALSLALNLAVAGIVGGSMLGGLGHPPPPVRDLGFGPYAQALSRDDREALMRAFTAEAPDLRDMRRGMRENVAALLAALRADPFDEAGLRAALATQDNRARARMEIGQRLLADRLVALTPEQRLAFADRLQEVLSRGPGKDRGPSRRD